MGNSLTAFMLELGLNPSNGSSGAARDNRAAHGLKAAGVKRGDRVIIVAENRPEWLVADVAIMSIGAVAVPAYTTNTTVNHLHIINDSGARFAIENGCTAIDHSPSRSCAPARGNIRHPVRIGPRPQPRSRVDGNPDLTRLEI